MGTGAQSWTVALKATLRRGETASLNLGATGQACEWSLRFLASVGNDQKGAFSDDGFSAMSSPLPSHSRGV